MPRSGEDTRQRILERATNVASIDGLEGLTIGRLASDIGVSKGAVANHFASKQDLQLRTIEAAAGIVETRIAGEAREVEPGLPRLRAAVDAWLDYIADPPFEGGCFFCTTTIEHGAKPGDVRDVLALAARFGLDLLLEQARLAQRLGELDDHETPEQVVFELHAYLQEANWARRILDEQGAIELAKTAIDRRLQPKDKP